MHGNNSWDMGQLWTHTIENLGAEILQLMVCELLWMHLVITNTLNKISVLHILE